MPRKSGPKPMTADVIELTGNRSKLSADEIEARRESTPKPRPIRAATPPGDLSNYARECWELHAPELDALGLLTVLDRGAFRFACESYALAREALDAMRPAKGDGTPDARKKGLEVVVRDHVHGGIKRHPAYLIYDSAQRAYLRWTVEFGLTPSARIGLRPAAPGRPLPGSEEDTAGDDDRAFFGA